MKIHKSINGTMRTREAIENEMVMYTPTELNYLIVELLLDIRGLSLSESD